MTLIDSVVFLISFIAIFFIIKCLSLNTSLCSTSSVITSKNIRLRKVYCDILCSLKYYSTLGKIQSIITVNSQTSGLLPWCKLSSSVRNVVTGHCLTKFWKCPANFALWSDMMTEHRTSTSWVIFLKVLSVNNLCSVQFVTCFWPKGRFERTYVLWIK